MKGYNKLPKIRKRPEKISISSTRASFLLTNEFMCCFNALSIVDSDSGLHQFVHQQVWQSCLQQAWFGRHSSRLRQWRIHGLQQFSDSVKTVALGLVGVYSVTKCIELHSQSLYSTLVHCTVRPVKSCICNNWDAKNSRLLLIRTYSVHTLFYPYLFVFCMNLSRYHKKIHVYNM